MSKITTVIKNLMKFVCLLTVVAYSPSISANEQFGEQALDNFLKKANYSGNILESDGVRSGIAVANYQEGSKTDVLFAFQGILCRGHLIGSIGRGTTKVKLTCSNDSKITGSGNSPVGFAQGVADVKLEDTDSGTKLIYFVDAQVGGKIAQVGSRLIDMTAKKMADIFFGKFSELISRETQETEGDESKLEVEKKKTQIEIKSIYWIAGIVVTTSVVVWFLLN